MLTTGFGEKSNQTGKSDFGYDLDKIKTAGFGYDFFTLGMHSSFGLGFSNN